MITIFQQPSNITYYSGSSYQFSILASSDLDDVTFKYKWSSSPDGVSWAAVADPSASTSNLRVLPSLPTYKNTHYKVTIDEIKSDGVVASTLDSSVAIATLFDGRTTVPPTRSRDGSKIRSRQANDLEYIQEPAMDGILSIGNIGGATLMDSKRNIEFPTIQNAISDAAHVGKLNTDSVIMNLNNMDPSGLPQLDVMLFSGVISSPTAGQPVILDVFGHRIEMVDGASSSAVRDKVLELLINFQTKGIYVRDVTVSGTDSITFMYRDFRDHIPEPWSQYGITLSWTVGSPARAGYGYWEMFMTEDKIAADSTTVKLYYWKRVG